MSACPTARRRSPSPRCASKGVRGNLIYCVDYHCSHSTAISADRQREGYAQAIVSKDFLQALRTGPHSKISLTYFSLLTQPGRNFSATSKRYLDRSL